MGELSFLTIIVSLAVCSLLVYAVFQYMKVRLTILEQSHKEQALILQQFIEESSTDIHRLYQMKSSSSSHNNNDNDTAAQYGGGYHGSIILEYANANANASSEYEEKPIAYNEPHMIHLDTALFQNKRASNLIEISSDSEDTTDCDDESASSGSDSSGSASDDESASSESSESASEANGDEHIDSNVTEFVEELVVECVNSVASPETKTITVNLGTITSSEEQPLDVMDMLYKKATSEEAGDAAPAPLSASFTGMSVTELRFLLKEKYKQQPEKHAEIQKMKKAELIQALQQAQ
jgi:hypothetical protein